MRRSVKSKLQADLKKQYQSDIADGLVSGEKLSLADARVQEQLRVFAERSRDYHRALPNPWEIVMPKKRKPKKTKKPKKAAKK